MVLLLSGQFAHQMGVAQAVANLWIAPIRHPAVMNGCSSVIGQNPTGIHAFLTPLRLGRQICISCVRCAVQPTQLALGSDSGLIEVNDPLIDNRFPDLIDNGLQTVGKAAYHVLECSSADRYPKYARE